MVDFKVFRGSEGGAIKEVKTTKSVGPHDVLIEVTHSGLCGTDIHFRGADMGLGHEGAGVVKQVGENVTQFKVGDRAGWGYQHDCCGHCKQCLTGKETMCKGRHLYGEAELDQGSFASHAIWHENFVFKIPDSIENKYAAPLMCGGATVFTALRMYDLKSTDRVGVVGIGGLGHLAIQFAAKMGCEVVVFSSTDSKKDEAMKLGATEFYATKGVKELKIERPIDQLLVTTSQQPDWKLYLPVLAPEATVYPLTVSFDDFVFPQLPLIQSGIRIQGSVIAPREIHRQMLTFVGHHGIKPIIQEFPMNVEGIEKAFKTLEDGDMRYRGVLVAQK
jgi:D-arabinose 1-dehydrogenase-like Zn-dependent alcohol dehydrogenase